MQTRRVFLGDFAAFSEAESDTPTRCCTRSSVGSCWATAQPVRPPKHAPTMFVEMLKSLEKVVTDTGT